MGGCAVCKKDHEVIRNHSTTINQITNNNMVINQGYRDKEKEEPKKEKKEELPENGEKADIVTKKAWGEYKILKFISQSFFYQLYKVIQQDTGLIRALKVIKKSSLKVNFKEPEAVKTFQKEMDFLKKLEHTNLLKIFDYYIDKDYLYLVVEYIPLGSLKDVFPNISRINEEMICKITKQLFQAVSFIHSNNIIHKSINLESLRVYHFNDKHPSQVVVKLDNYGITSYIKNFDSKNLERGDPYYFSPEYLKENTFEKGIDYWACGVMLNFFLLGEMPFNGESPDEIKKNIYVGTKTNAETELYKDISPEAFELLNRLLEYDYPKRISLKEALLNKWFITLEKKKATQKQTSSPSRKKYNIKSYERSESDDSKKLLSIDSNSWYKKSNDFKSRSSAGTQLNETEDFGNCYRLQSIKDFIENDKIHQKTTDYLNIYIQFSQDINELKAIIKKRNLNMDDEEPTLDFKTYIAILEELKGHLVAEFEISNVFQNLDHDMEGLISFSTFVQTLIESNVLIELSFVKEKFKSFIDENEAINVEELATFFKNYNSEKTQNLSNILFQVGRKLMKLEALVKLFKKDLLKQVNNKSLKSSMTLFSSSPSPVKKLKTGLAKDFGNNDQTSSFQNPKIQNSFSSSEDFDVEEKVKKSLKKAKSLFIHK